LKEENETISSHVKKDSNLPDPYKNSADIELLLVEPGTFQMGSDHREQKWYDNERPAHQVRITNPFYLGKYPLTNRQLVNILGEVPNSKFIIDDKPVSKISWNDAQGIIDRLNEIENTDKYRLPTEAEWEYACRAGTTTRFYYGADNELLMEYGWCRDDGVRGPQPVGQKKPNNWGFHDMHGNVWEWVQDIYLPDYNNTPTDGSANLSSPPDATEMRVLRGGSWQTSSYGCRSSSRFFNPPDVHRRSSRVGFRIASDV